jgi:hypothetical protein
MVRGLGAGSDWFGRGAGGVFASRTSGAGARRRVRAGDERGEQVADLVAGERDLAVGRWSAGVLGGGGDGQERGGEHGQGDPAVPGVPAADLMLVQADQALAGLEVFHGPPLPGDPASPSNSSRAADAMS